MSIPLDTRIRFTDLLASATPEEMEDFRQDRIARLRPAMGGDVDDLYFKMDDDSVSVSYEISVAQAFELDFESVVIAQRLVTQAGIRRPFNELLDAVENAKASYRADLDRARRQTV